MEKSKRPKITHGQTERIETGCGHLYVIMNTNEGTPIEIFTSLGKCGGCPGSMCEGIGRAITTGLKYGVPVEEYVKQLQGIKCPNPCWDDGVQVLSCPDAIAKALKDAFMKEEKCDQVNPTST
jgi:ribonucleoside-diphosphate reductase alpha chain